jgi:hypothetical protein
MACWQCGADLERPGDYCLVCRTTNTDSVVLDCDPDRTTVTALLDGDIVAQRTITTTPESGGEAGVVQERNYAGLIADDVRRKRPETVYAAGDRGIVRAVRDQLHLPFYRVPDEDPVAAAIDRHGDDPLAVVETPPAEKIGGSHTTLIGGRTGKEAIMRVAGHPHVKKIIPGPIDAGGSGSRSGLRAKATRADGTGNVRLLLREGSSVQENRVVTTATDRAGGERVRAALNEELAEAGFGGQ